MTSVLGVTVLDVVAAVRASSVKKQGRAPVIEAITINRPRSDVYAAWRDFEQLPRYMDWLESVQARGNGLSHWVAKLPVGGTVEWDAILIEDRPGERISWRTVDGAPAPHSGTVLFKSSPNGIATEVEVEMQYDVPGGRKLAGLFAKLASKPQIEGDLRRFKQVLETGEIVRSDASIHRGPHPARPSMQKGLVP
jgi:uncharacterized membrane protein